jgi:hypothetical protein
MTFLGVVRFISLISFQRYRWCRYQSFIVFIWFFFSFLVFLSLSSLFIVNCVSLLLILERIAYNTSNSWVLNYMWLYKLCYFLKYFMHYVILFNFFKGLKKQKLKLFHVVIFYYLFIFWVLIVQFNLLYIYIYKNQGPVEHRKRKGEPEKNQKHDICRNCRKSWGNGNLQDKHVNQQWSGCRVMSKSSQ